MQEKPNFHFHSDIVIGPTTEMQRRSQKEALDLACEELTVKINRVRELETTLKDKYGDDLVDFGQAYSERIRPGSHGLVHLQMQMVEVKEVRPLFAKALTEKLMAQPEESRVDWLDNFLKDLDKLSLQWMI